MKKFFFKAVFILLVLYVGYHLYIQYYYSEDDDQSKNELLLNCDVIADMLRRGEFEALEELGLDYCSFGYFKDYVSVVRSAGWEWEPEKFVFKCMQSGKDPLLVLSIASTASHCGKSELLREFNNPFGIHRSDGKFVSYNSTEEALDAVLLLLDYYKEEYGCENLRDISFYYAADSQDWFSSTSAAYTKFNRKLCEIRNYRATRLQKY